MSGAREIRELLGGIVEREGGAPDGWEDQIAAFLQLLWARNRSVNLISRKTEGDALERHVLPSLAALSVVPADEALRVLDVGSGGGFPGIPLRILRPRIRLDLAEATRKKADFLERCVETLALETAGVHWCRIESPSPALLERAPFDRILARAVGQETTLRRSTRPLLAPAGQTWVFAAPDDAGARIWRDESGRVVTALRQL